VGLLALVGWQLAGLFRPRPPNAAQAEVIPARLPLTVGAYGLGLALLPGLGYFLVTLVYLPAMTWFLGYRRVGVIAGLTIGWLLMSELVFQRLLHVDLPRGTWW